MLNWDMIAQASNDLRNLDTVKKRNTINPLALVLFLISLVGVVGLTSRLIYLDYQANKNDRSLNKYLEDVFVQRFISDCVYKMSGGPLEFPLQLEADVELLDGSTMVIKNPTFCNNKFEYTVEIGGFGRPVTEVYTSGGLPPEDEIKIYEEGYPNVTAYFIGDKESYMKNSQDIKVIDKGKLSDLHGSDKKYSSKNALLTFYNHDRVYFNENSIYVVQVFFNEK